MKLMRPQFLRRNRPIDATSVAMETPRNPPTNQGKYFSSESEVASTPALFTYNW